MITQASTFAFKLCPTDLMRNIQVTIQFQNYMGKIVIIYLLKISYTYKYLPTLRITESQSLYFSQQIALSSAPLGFSISQFLASKSSGCFLMLEAGTSEKSGCAGGGSPSHIPFGVLWVSPHSEFRFG